MLTFDIIGLAIVGTEPKRTDAKIIERYPMNFVLLNFRKPLHRI